ncbi:MAG: ABC transporter ATP-binding protein [Calditerrivibrio sp.]|nr:ABC transporter ATP-binding protein [Calditerrivibrio sp.]
MVELRDITVQNRGFTLNKISIDIKTGNCHCLIGPTGCGKTTLLEAILGLRKVKSGSIMVDGKDITALPIHKRGFSYVPQDLAIFPHLTVYENIVYGIKYGNLENKDELYKLAMELSESLGISNLLNRKAANLSGGERQRVALVRAISTGNKYLLLDEPLSSLHEGLKRELWFLLKELQKKYNFTVLMVSHDIEEATFMANHISVIIAGKLMQTGVKDEVYQYPANREVAEFFGIKNIFDAQVIGIYDGYYKAYCDMLGTEIAIPVGNVKGYEIEKGKNISFAIRSENIIIQRPDLPMKKDNILKGVIKTIYSSGPTSIVLFKPEGKELVVEITMPEFAMAKLSLKPNDEASIALRMERIFVLD